MIVLPSDVLTKDTEFTIVASFLLLDLGESRDFDVRARPCFRASPTMSCAVVSVVKVAAVIPFELSITSDVIKFAA